VADDGNVLPGDDWPRSRALAVLEELCAAGLNDALAALRLVGSRYDEWEHVAAGGPRGTAGVAGAAGAAGCFETQRLVQLARFYRGLGPLQGLFLPDDTGPADGGAALAYLRQRGDADGPSNADDTTPCRPGAVAADVLARVAHALDDAFFRGQRSDCPRCGRGWVQEPRHCTHMACSCGAKFCYICERMAPLTAEEHAAAGRYRLASPYLHTGFQRFVDPDVCLWEHTDVFEKSRSGRRRFNLARPDGRGCPLFVVRLASLYRTLYTQTSEATDAKATATGASPPRAAPAAAAATPEAILQMMHNLRSRAHLERVVLLCGAGAVARATSLTQPSTRRFLASRLMRLPAWVVLERRL
jgi:hypothetical protein